MLRCTPIQIIGGMQMWTILKLLGEYSQIIGRIYPPIPPCFGTSGQSRISLYNAFKCLPFFDNASIQRR